MKKKGFTIFITGLPGSGKTSIAKVIKKKLSHIDISTLEISGDEIRKIFNLEGYDIASRKSYIKSYGLFCKTLNEKGLNVIISVVGLFNFIRKWNRKNIKNYIEIYIESDLKKNIKFARKKLYKKRQNLWVKHLKPQFPKNFDIKIKNNYETNINSLVKKFQPKLIKMIKRYQNK
tara:strand:- start:804 stop:1328 length:525 start_codon:yes stop_codon:yes gene_type:complete